ncbi:hypothetical protein H1R20_g1577, partial [Candolleomyces eurysporus]
MHNFPVLSARGMIIADAISQWKAAEAVNVSNGTRNIDDHLERDAGDVIDDIVAGFLPLLEDKAEFKLKVI